MSALFWDMESLPINRGGQENGMVKEMKGNKSSLQRLLGSFRAVTEIVLLLVED